MYILYYLCVNKSDKQMETVTVQGWDLIIDDVVLDILISDTNIANMDTSGSKVVKYMELIENGYTDYPPVYLKLSNDKNRVEPYYEIIDGAHRIKALKLTGSTTVKTKLVLEIK